ncbi:HNH endonuclease [Yersinia phage phiR2-01]|uniref:Phage-associated homing endonuclease n=1 Tax=Yersinia phage phiR2-01 TaxID=1206557 RepID=I7KQW5_9CAUD|nr:HNH endonuclease [Yersinia phage phiR2-01]CCI88530.1 phage-associated homing endonuclease [Yersinia phage phiR2-01]
MITQDELTEILDYNQETGIFTWKVDKNWKIKAGSVAGSLCNGYINIMIKGKNYRAHRLAFLFMEGYIPKIVDHKDRNKLNNAWDNLRQATKSQNESNVEKRSDNTSGYKNVCWRSDLNKWRVEVRKDGKNYSGGYYAELIDAVDAANELRFELFGEFALYEQYIG